MSGHGHGHGHEDGDNFGKMVGVATALLGLCVVVATICAHKAHTNSLTAKADASDTWSYFQAKKNRATSFGLNATDLQMDGEAAEKALKEIARLRSQQKDLEAELVKAKSEGKELAAAANSRGAAMEPIRFGRRSIP